LPYTLVQFHNNNKMVKKSDWSCCTLQQLKEELVKRGTRTLNKRKEEIVG